MKMKLLQLLLLVQFFLEAYARDYAKTALKILQHYSDEIFNTAGNDSQCVEDLKIFLTDLRGSKMWTVQMLDASAKLHPGILTGNIIFMGNFDECLDINVISNGSQIQGQYCSAALKPTSVTQECVQKKFNEYPNGNRKTLEDISENLYLNWDVCIPASCSSNDLQKLWNFTQVRYQIPFYLDFTNDHCNSREKSNYFSNIDVLAIITFGVIGAVVLLSTAYDVFIFQKRKDKQFNFFMAFSYYTNAKRLIATKHQEGTHITCLHGIRVISMMWIILGHHFMFVLFGTAINNVYYLQWLKHHENAFIIGAIACVDTFLLISGFLIVYTIMVAKEMGITINVLVFWGHRFLRLSPSLAAMILFYMGILNHLGSGPIWYNMDEAFVQPCMTNWWSTLLYIQNYANPSSLCITQTWYLAVDTQLYLLSPLIYFPLQRWPKVTIACIVGLIAASVLAAMHVTFYYEITEPSLRVLWLYFEKLYIPTHMRMAPWLVGTLLGHFIIKTKNWNIVIAKPLVLLLWIISVVLMVGISYGYTAFFNYKLPTLIVALYMGFSRVAWALCLSWIIFACTRGYGGYIHTFLSLPIFRVLARLSYNMYLTHIVIIFGIKSQIATHSYVDNLFSFHEFWGNYVFTLGLSIIWTLTFESPVTILESILTKREKKRTKNLKKKGATSEILTVE